MTEHKKKKKAVSCTDCKAWACFPDISVEKTWKRGAPPYCPTNAQEEVCEQARAKYTGKALAFARCTTLIENGCYAIDFDKGNTILPMVTLHPRAEEIIMLAKVSEFKKLGLAFCIEMQKEASLYTDILEKNGLEVAAVSCKAGGIPKEEMGVTGEEKVMGPESEETLCSGLIMAELLNNENTEMNVLMGICVGQDSLFYKYADAFTVPFVVMDRVYGGATMEGLYQVFNSWGNRNYTDDIQNGIELMRSSWLKREGGSK